jgi:hypothetical protein
MEKVHNASPSDYIKIQLRNFNAKIRKEEIYHRLTRKQSLHLNTNKNGQKLVNFMATKNTVVSSTCFSHKDIHKQTWWYPIMFSSN